MSIPEFRCCACRAGFTMAAEGLSAQEIACPQCSHVYPVIEKVPVFASHATKPGGSFAFSEASFNYPAVYQAFVGLKVLVYQDAKIGVAEYVKGRNVLDVGCGPTIYSDYREYVPDDAATVTGLDMSVPFALSARRKHPESKYFFAAGSIDNIPFADKTFDTTIVSFVIHHVEAQGTAILAELRRVTRKHIIIYDHLRSSKRVIEKLQQLYWKVADGGCNYMTAPEWDTCLSGLVVEKRLRTGALFGHVIKLVLRIE